MRDHARDVSVDKRVATDCRTRTGQRVELDASGSFRARRAALTRQDVDRPGLRTPDAVINCAATAFEFVTVDGKIGMPWHVARAGALATEALV